MNAAQLIKSLSENRSKRHVDVLIAQVLREPMDWEDWFEAFKTTEFPLKWHLTWWLSHYIEADQNIGNYLQQQIWDEIGTINHHSIQRDFWKMLTRIHINEDLAGLAYERAIKTVTSQKEEVAVRAYAIEVATNIVLAWPELSHEVNLIFENLSQEEPASIQIRKRKFLEKLKHLKLT